MPLSAFRGHEAHLESLRAKYRFYASWGVGILDRTAWLWNAADSSAKNRRVSRVSDRLRRRMRLPASELGPADLRDHLDRIADFRPAMIYGFSRAVFALALEAEAIGFRSPVALRVVCMTGEAATDHMRQTVSRAFGVPAVMEYGSVECGFLAGQGADGALRVREDVALIESLPAANGLFEVCVTVLNNPWFPLLRYRIGDLVEESVRYPQHGFAVLPQVAGRNDDMLWTRSGRQIHAACVDEIFEDLAQSIRRYRVHQDLSGAVQANVELRNPAERFDTSKLLARLRPLVEGYPVRVEVVSMIPQTAAGKHRLVTSEMPGPEKQTTVVASNSAVA
jgi:phenylacetate-coenzyme A ligase PaaK-like adenylate-forming protein